MNYDKLLKYSYAQVVKRQIRLYKKGRWGFYYHERGGLLRVSASYTFESRLLWALENKYLLDGGHLWATRPRMIPEDSLPVHIPLPGPRPVRYYIKLYNELHQNPIHKIWKWFWSKPERCVKFAELVAVALLIAYLLYLD